MKKILLVGGGSGGHITPVLAVADEIKLLSPQTELVYVISKGDKLVNLPEDSKSIQRVHQIRAGKLRRYHGEGLKQLLDVKTVVKNIRDIFYVLIGIFQSLALLRSEKPDIIFIKGGFVGIPIGIAAMVLRIPYITHDSDAVPGLANRVISRGAKLHTVAMPTNEYKYEARKTIQVGVPVNKRYKFVSEDSLKAAKKRLDISPSSKVILVTGGGLGAVRLNTTVVSISKKLTKNKDNRIIHLVGPGNSEEVEAQYAAAGADLTKIIVKDFVPDLYNYSAASDIIITRAGATTLTEFAIQSKACIVVPNANLTGGHQSKNAKVLEKLDAIEVIEDRQIVQDPNILYEKISALLANPKRIQELSTNISKTIIRDSAKKIATILTDSGLDKK